MGEGSALTLDAQRIAESLFGDYMMTNMVAIGAAYQAGWLPIRAEWIEAAIRLNGTQVDANTMAFRAGRLWVHAPEQIQALGTLKLHPPRVVRVNRHRDLELWSRWYVLLIAAVCFSLNWALRRRWGQSG